MKVSQIRQLNTVSAPRSFIFVDTESTVDKVTIDYTRPIKDLNKLFENHAFRLGVAIFVSLNKKYEVIEREIIHFEDTDTFWRFVEIKSASNNGLWVMSHNLKYDLVNLDLIPFLDRGTWFSDVPIMGNNFIMTMYKLKQVKGKIIKHRTVKFVDTFNYIKLPLAKIGEKFGQLKTKVDFDTTSTKEMFEYCQNDTEIVERFMLELVWFIIKNELGSLKYTIASTSFNIFRTRFNNGSLYYHDDNDLLVYERDAYKGGRVECFRVGLLPDSEYYLMDVNSMYVYIMSKSTLPTKPLFRTDSISVDELEDLSSDMYLIADVLIDNGSEFPAYCMKYTFNDLTHNNPNNPDETNESEKLIFPSGIFRTKLHNPELRNAIKHNQIKHVFSSVIYEHGKVMADFAHFFAQMKTNATNPVDREFAKLIGNSAYGRLALRKYITDIIDIDNADFFEDDKHFSTNPNSKNKANRRTPPNYFTGFYIHDDDTNQIEQYYRWGNSLYRQYTVDDISVKNTNVALAGAITAYSRMLLYFYMGQAGFENVFYLDTDSLLVNRLGYANLKQYENEHKLGFLKLEYLEKSKGQYSTNKVELFAPKWYVMGERRRSKGVALNSEFHNGKYIFWRFSTFKDHLRSRGDKFGRKLVAKTVKLNYNKGIVSGGIVSPFLLRYDERCQKNLIT